MSHSEKPDTDTSPENAAEVIDDSAENESVVIDLEEPSAAKESVESGSTAEAQDQPETGESDDGEPQAESEPTLNAEQLLVQLEQANEEAVSLKDQMLRAQAEMQNLRKRSQRDVENAHKYGLEKFLSNLLPVIDSLEKAIESAGQAEDNNKAILEGVELCLKMMLDILSKENVVQIDPEGEPFDPKFHEAMSVIEHPDMEPNSVVNVFQKGYTLNERLVRPAMVIVSKAPEQK